MQRRSWMIIALVLVASMLLAACGGAEEPTQAPAPTQPPATAEPTAAPPTDTPAPVPTQPPATAEPTAAPPTDTPAPAPADTPTAEAPATGPQTQPVDMTDLQTYADATGLFSIDIPASWSVEDKTSSSEVLVRWTDSGENAVVLVNVFQEDTQMTQDELTKLLQDYLQTSYENQPEWSMDQPTPQTDGSVLIVWSYTAEASGGVKAKLLGNSFIEQIEDKVSILTTAVPDEQFDALLDSTNEIINSYQIDPSVAIESVLPTPLTADSTATQAIIIGDLETYTYPTGLFSIDIPVNWTLKDNSKSGEAIVLWTDPTENGLIAVDLFEESQEQTQDELVAFLQTFLEDSFESEKDFLMDQPKPQTDGSVLIVWSYTAETSGGVETKLLGNSFIEQLEDKISILTTAVPDEQFDALLDSTNEIINSYQIDPSADLP